jgi:tetratricopeptide (TPR) repeat protein
VSEQPVSAGNDPMELLAAAERLFGEGRLEEAWESADVARAGLALVDPFVETNALHLLACIAAERGFARVGEERLARAIALRDGLAEGSVPIDWHELLGTLATANDDHNTAAAAWETAYVLLRAHRDATGEGTDRLCVALRGLGDAHLARGEKSRAREVFGSLASEASGLVAAASDPHAFRHVTSALHRLGDACHEDGDLAAAIAAYRDAVREARSAVAATGNSLEALWDLSVGLNRLGGAQLESDQAQAAIASFEQAVEIRRGFCESAGRSPEALSGLASSLSKLSAALLQDGDEEGSVATQGEAAALDHEAALGSDHHPLTMIPPPVAG